LKTKVERPKLSNIPEGPMRKQRKEILRGEFSYKKEVQCKLKGRRKTDVLYETERETLEVLGDEERCLKFLSKDSLLI